MKKWFLVFIFLAIIVAGLVTAAPDFSSAASDIIRWMQDIFGPFFHAIIGENSTDFFFAKILILMLLFFVINLILRRVPLFERQAFVAFIIAAVISIIAVRFISENSFTMGIILPYATTGIVIGTILPILVIFMFVHWTGIGGAGRRLTWVLVGVTLLVLGIAFSDKIPDNLEWIYWIMFVIVIIFLIFDKGIHSYFRVWEMSAFYRGANERTIAALQAEFLNILHVDTPIASRRRATIARQLRDLGAALP